MRLVKYESRTARWRSRGSGSLLAHRVNLARHLRAALGSLALAAATRRLLDTECQSSTDRQETSKERGPFRRARRGRHSSEKTSRMTRSWVRRCFNLSAV